MSAASATTPEAPGDAVAWRVEVGGDTVSAVYEAAHGVLASTLFVCAHGAGGHMADKGVLAVAQTLRARGVSIVRFNFVYREKKLNRPDPMPQLEACVAAVAAHTRETVKPQRLILGGRSMGGRAASMLAAKGHPCDGLLLLAYPLHPAGQTERLRDAHLPRIHVPVLCFNGTRDALCEKELMLQVLERVSDRWTMHWLEGADDSFHVLKSSGRTDRQVLDEIGAATEAWLSEHVAAVASVNA